MVMEAGQGSVPLDARPGELSVGLCQRVAIRRVPAASPSAVLADEPTSALYRTSAAGVLWLLRGLADSGGALVVVGHDTVMLRTLADRVLEMREGRLSLLSYSRNGTLPKIDGDPR
jgi:ABC-type lipoprotein export system ATPase subunit